MAARSSQVDRSSIRIVIEVAVMVGDGKMSDEIRCVQGR